MEHCAERECAGPRKAGENEGRTGGWEEEKRKVWLWSRLWGKPPAFGDGGERGISTER